MRKELITSNEQACCPSVSHSILETSFAQETSNLLAALADPTRLAILSLLAKDKQSEICVCDITTSFKLGQPTISHHLKILRDNGFIRGVKRGKWVYYSLIQGRLEEVKSRLDQL